MNKTNSFFKFFEWDYQINIHAIGDQANRAAINAFEAVLGSDCHGCNQEKRLRIEHAQIIVRSMSKLDGFLTRFAASRRPNTHFKYGHSSQHSANTRYI